MKNRTIRCVIFDCEGTLIDSERLSCIALVRVFNELGVSLTLENVLQHFSGGKIADILINTSKFAGINADIDRLELRYRQELTALFHAELKPMPGAIDLLEQLKRYNIEYCVASNAPHDKMAAELRLAGLESYFTGGRIYSAFEANSWKPEPDLVRYCAMSMGFSLADCMYVDDTPKGVEAGISAGVMTFQLCSPLFSHPVLHPDVITLHHLQQLVEYLGDTSTNSAQAQTLIKR
ncbi:HAD-IA family hydrolase [Vibrio metschnikovii]|nr:HAD-IA family hydrolase [Vibrio metschnikovii]EKO3598513.1 HAD-IA family hydrolase [Vibrio metschnikovii]EKO3710964.1 HAD-IA family hydrolase [Vibrio metschnikovii]EKO3900270.1 HAD-IA family hydrolase [Vibrio metschnikovii]